MASRIVLNEVAYQLRLLMSSVPSLWASVEQRSGFYLFKAEFYESFAAAEPASAAQAMDIASRARQEARTIALDYLGGDSNE